MTSSPLSPASRSATLRAMSSWPSASPIYLSIRNRRDQYPNKIFIIAIRPPQVPPRPAPKRQPGHAPSATGSLRQNTCATTLTSSLSTASTCRPTEPTRCGRSSEATNTMPTPTSQPTRPSVPSSWISSTRRSRPTAATEPKGRVSLLIARMPRHKGARFLGFPLVSLRPAKFVFFNLFRWCTIFGGNCVRPFTRAKTACEAATCGIGQKVVK